MFKKNKGIKFKTTKQKNASKARNFIIGFASFLIVFAAVSVVYVFKAYNLKMSDFFGEKTVTESSSEESNAPIKPEGKATFLLAGTSDKNDELYFVFAVRADLDKGEVSVLPIDPDAPCTVDGAADTVLGFYKKNSVRGLLDAAKAVSGVQIDRYAVSTASQFKSAINAVGGAVINIPERISYKTDGLSVSLMPGSQTLKGETLLKYLRYCKTKQNGADIQAQVLCEMLPQYIKKSYIGSGREYFSLVINSLESDITIVDYSKAQPQLEAVAAMDSPLVYKAVQSFDAQKKR